MQAGFGREEITPPLGTELAGYGYYLERRATHVIDPLYARAVALKEGDDTFLIVSCDCLGLSRALVRDVLNLLFRQNGIAPDHVMLVSVHTHTGPALKYHEGCGAVNPEYAQTVAPRIHAACQNALRDLRSVVGIDYTIKRIGDEWVYNRASNEGPVDRFARSFHIKRDNAPLIVIASYACHAVSRGNRDGISADYPGEVCRIIEEDKNCRSIFLNGLCGDIDPYPPEKAGRQARLAPFAKTVAEACRADAAAQSLPRSITGGRINIALNLMPVTKSSLTEAAEASIKANGADGGAAKVASIWLSEMLAKFDKLEKSEPFSVSWLRLGNIPIIALPFEGFTRTAELIREALSDSRALTLGCAEEILGYLPTQDDIRRRAYAALESTFLYKRLPPLPGEAERIGRLLGAMMTETAK
ncbi:MAG: hypothetical protein LBD16_03135 [Oscillospiraceae bacterium]|nr:hypothetical protein [Oscillospiraceae bacterium]